jgi:hypothetical protein
LTQPYDIGVRVFVEPAAAHDELVTEVPNVRYRSTEAGNSKLQESQQDFESRTGLPPHPVV